MKKSMIYALAVIVILFFLGFIAYIFLFSDDCKKVSGTDRDTCYMNKAMANQDVKACEKISALDGKESCYDGIAGELKDTSICEKISVREGISNCYRNVAVKKQDVLVCDTIQDKSAIEECYIYVANELGDRPICNKISVDETGASTVKDRCLMEVAIKINDREMCYGIRTQIQKDNCLQNTIPAQ